MHYNKQRLIMNVLVLQRAASPTYIQEQKEIQERWERCPLYFYRSWFIYTISARFNLLICFNSVCIFYLSVCVSLYKTVMMRTVMVTDSFWHGEPRHKRRRCWECSFRLDGFQIIVCNETVSSHKPVVFSCF